MPEDNCRRTPRLSIAQRLAMNPLFLAMIFVFGVVVPMAHLVGKASALVRFSLLPVEQNATCGKGVNAIHYTRHEIWTDCFMRLGGMAEPRPGELNVNKVTKFRSEHLYLWERWLTPSAEQIVERCDQPPFDGWVTQREFEETTNRECLADADAICHARTVCERETRHLGRDRSV